MTAASSRVPNRPPKKISFFLIILLACLLLSLTFITTAAAQQPLDLSELGRRGLGERSRDLIVTQALTVRARPPLEIGFILQMAEYGGDELAKAYLEMDAETNQMERSPLTPEAMKNLMASALSVSDLLLLINSASGASQSENSAPFAAVVPITTVAETTVNDSSVNYPTVNYPGPLAGNVEKPTPPANPASSPDYYQTMIAVTGPQIPVLSGASALTTPQASTYQASAHQAPIYQDPIYQGPTYQAQQGVYPEIDKRKTPQVLYPGQQADPARPMPENPGPYWTREPQANHTFFMGVVDEVKADGHRYEVHTNGKRGVMGQETLTRGSGHKVYRYFSGDTEVAQGPAAYNDSFAGPSAPNDPYDPQFNF
ncbi:MAG: hypothetical protein LBT62_05255 [Deltaproteobacteria bacterium]|jgi:hypothetical protein|nr:hypothetical protein [Deltaproteobacteria bacterium]